MCLWALCQAYHLINLVPRETRDPTSISMVNFFGWYIMLYKWCRSPSTSPFLTTQHVSSTYHFHNLGWEGADSFPMAETAHGSTLSLFKNFTTRTEVGIDLRHISSSTDTQSGERWVLSASLYPHAYVGLGWPALLHQWVHTTWARTYWNWPTAQLLLRWHPSLFQQNAKNMASTFLCKGRNEGGSMYLESW